MTPERRFRKFVKENPCMAGDIGAEGALHEVERLTKALTDEEAKSDRLCAEIVSLRHALNKIAWPTHFNAVGQDPREIAKRALNLGKENKL